MQKETCIFGNMNINEVLRRIKAIPKAYTHVKMEQGLFANTLRNIEAGLAKQKTIDEFVGKFGFKRNEITYDPSGFCGKEEVA